MLRSVHVRVRPLSDTEKEGRGNAWRIESNALFQMDPASGAALNDAAPYKLDTVFRGGCSTAEVYDRTTRDLISQVIGGFNSTVFAYGQTSSGKTHTMRGTSEDPGIVPRAVAEIFELINAAQDREFLLRVSYMEVGGQHPSKCFPAPYPHRTSRSRPPSPPCPPPASLT